MKKDLLNSRNPALPTTEKTFSLPEWHDGLLPEEKKSKLLIVRDVALSNVCSAVVPPEWSIREMLKDYVGTRAFEGEEGEVEILFEVVTEGKQDEAPTRVIGKRTGRQITLQFQGRHTDLGESVSEITSVCSEEGS